MAKKIVNFGTVFKRSSCLNAKTESTYMGIDSRCDRIKSQLEAATGTLNPSLKISIRSFIESICNDGANMYYREPLFIMEQCNRVDPQLSREILSDYTGRIIPYIEDLSGMSETVERYELTEDQKSSILETVSAYITADRILQNHERISKRFNLESEILKYKSKGLKTVVETCCDMIDTYTIKPYQKLNLCIEEMCYILEKNGVVFEKEDLVKYTTEYFALRTNNMNERELGNFRKALTENYCVEEDDLVKVQHFLGGSFNTDSITNSIYKFYLAPDKTTDALSSILDSTVDCATITDIESNLDKVLQLMWSIYKGDVFGEDEFQMYYEELCKKIMKRIHDIADKNIYNFSREDIDILRDKVDSVHDNIIGNTDDDFEMLNKINKFKEATRKELLHPIYNIRELLYHKDNLENLRRFYDNENEEKPVQLEEGKIFKFHNLINAAINLDKFLQGKAKKLFKAGKDKLAAAVKKAHSILFNEDASMYSYINEYGRFDFVAAQYYIDESCLDEIHDFFNEACREFNQKLALEGNHTSKAYYIINPGVVEVHLEDSTVYALTEDQKKLVAESASDSLDIYVEELALIEAVCESCEEYFKDASPETIKEKLVKFTENEEFTLDHYKVALEALSLLDVSRSDVELFTEKFTNLVYSRIVTEGVADEDRSFLIESRQINNIYSNWTREENVPFDIQWEAYQILSAVLEAKAPAKPIDATKNSATSKKTDTTKNTKEEEKQMTPEEAEFKKNPFKGININSMKLYLEGLKSKLKNMSQKEKEVSKNLDMNFRTLVSNMKNALISDRREAIIKGSVIPSFSKCIKIAIGLAGIGLVAGNPFVPLVVAIGGFAVSKRLTQKERILLLDEIETELEVLEKEISMAESKNQLKKYRTLLKYKKDLQRQYQRIKYNVRVGKDILPGSAVGFTPRD